MAVAETAYIRVPIEIGKPRHAGCKQISAFFCMYLGHSCESSRFEENVILIKLWGGSPEAFLNNSPLEN